MVENLNGDVIFDICKFMDLPSIVSLAAVYPRRSADIFRVLKNRVYSLRVVGFESFSCKIGFWMDIFEGNCAAAYFRRVLRDEKWGRKGNL